MDERRRHEENREAWDATAAKYEEEEASDIAFLRAGGSSLLEPERRCLGDLGSWCRRAVHLQCAGGLDTLSLWRQGAAEVVGLDISERMIRSARRRSEALGAPATWVCCDVLNAPRSLDGTADLVYTGRGALPWVMDLAAWAAVAARLLRPGGRLYLFEGHPLDWVWESDAPEYRLASGSGGYFSRGVCVDRRWPAPYLARTLAPGAGPVHCHERQWTLGDTLNSLVEAGLRLRRFEEHPDLYWDQFPNLPEEQAALLPHTFSLLMEKG